MGAKDHVWAAEKTGQNRDAGSAALSRLPRHLYGDPGMLAWNVPLGNVVNGTVLGVLIPAIPGWEKTSGFRFFHRLADGFQTLIP